MGARNLIPVRDDEPELEADRGGKIFGTRNGAAVWAQSYTEKNFQVR